MKLSIMIMSLSEFKSCDPRYDDTGFSPQEKGVWDLI